jgi:hypothetical protein
MAATRLSGLLLHLQMWEPYPESLVIHEGRMFFLGRTGGSKILGILTDERGALPRGFAGTVVETPAGPLHILETTHEHAEALRAALPWLSPRPLGLSTSAGCGDRLGLATPGHVQAAREVGRVAMIFAQQSIREMVRTGRTPEQVMDDATWGAFQAGWQEPLGADADHLKTTDDVDRCCASGFTFFTIDPGAHVDAEADDCDRSDLKGRYDALPWSRMEIGSDQLLKAYAAQPHSVEDAILEMSEEVVARAAVKYGRAIAHTAAMYRHLERVMAGRPFELEVSVDETDTPTSHEQHFFIASELRRLGVRWVSLAPRYVGRFEKGVDYIPSSGLCGDLSEFETDFAGHAAIARALGPYKLSLHSGSDKFSIYEIAAEKARGLVHLKTAGTSYLEALRAVAAVDPPLFRDILAFAIIRYPEDRASYHVSANLQLVPDPSALSDDDLPGLLDHFDTRQVLHVSFGSVLTSETGLKERLYAALEANEEAYYSALRTHFVRHLRPLASVLQE